MEIDYEHSRNTHELLGPRVAFGEIFGEPKPRSLLDVGCGIGTWLKAAQESGLVDILGVDGISPPPEQFLVSTSFFRRQDFTRPWNLGRHFDAVICLEVAEHLDEPCASVLIDALVTHSNCIVFSAACPGQTGQHHVNCQWPAYWQKLFNDRGYVCSDALRWKIWNDGRIESWYRQNMFMARRDAELAGHEPRILPVIHPVQFALMADADFAERLKAIEQGWLPFKWYLSYPLRALTQKILKKLT
jgi:SAM-dependent methyltransferase